jgi:hypothetical protein
MSSQAVFRIVADWTPRPRPRPYNDADFRLWDVESRALFAFVARNHGALTLHFGDLTVGLALDDLPMVFDTLDAVTTALCTENGRAEMYFAEMGTDLRLSLRRNGDGVLVGFHAGLTAPPEFMALDGTEITIDADSFVMGWLDLRERVRAAFPTQP